MRDSTPLQTSGGYLALRGITKRYNETAPPVVSGCDLDVARGEFITLLGPSGCGKTTILRIIAGLVPPSAGHVLLGGEDITRRPVHARNIGLVFQNYALFPHLSAERNIAFGLDMRGIRGRAARDRISRALELVRLGEFGRRMPRELSGGQQQRVALARALVIEPAILLLDEPLSNLDAKLRDELRTEIREIQTRLGITALFVTHDQAEALTMSDRVAVMNHGRLEQVGTPTEIYERPASPFVAGFVGRTNRLAATVETSRSGYSLLVAHGLRFAARKQLPAGLAATVMIRPHRMRLSRSPVPDHEDINAVPATIRRIVFAGDVIQYEADAAGTSLFIENQTASQSDSNIAAGDQVLVEWPVSDTLVFACE
jgi:putative spermidine/putrescine transport system ATP-binding protein